MQFVKHLEASSAEAALVLARLTQGGAEINHLLAGYPDLGVQINAAQVRHDARRCSLLVVFTLRGDGNELWEIAMKQIKQTSRS